MKALIETYNNNRIVQIELDDTIFPVISTLQWIDCPNDCQTDWSYHNGKFIRPGIASPQILNGMDEKPSEKKDELLTSHSNTVNTNALPIAEAQAGASWRDEVCIKCYELMDIVRSGNMRTLSQEEKLVVFSVLKWMREFAEGKPAN